MKNSLSHALRGTATVIAAELRPPRVELGPVEGMDAWIDMYHAVRSLTHADVPVFLTDSAIGTQEEHNLRHLVSNLGQDVERDHVVPFLTAKHSLDYCVTYAEQAWQQGFPSLVVLGGDQNIGRPRCVEHAWQLRQAIRVREPKLALGGWANPQADPVQQVQYLLDKNFTQFGKRFVLVPPLFANSIELIEKQNARGGPCIIEHPFEPGRRLADPATTQMLRLVLQSKRPFNCAPQAHRSSDQ